jgi:hypothetical protein
MMNEIRKVAPSSMGVNRSGTFNLRCRALAANITKALRAILAVRGPTVTVELWRLLGSPNCLSRAQFRRLLRNARKLRRETLFYGGVVATMYGLKGDHRWDSAMQAFFADRRKAHSEKNLAPEEQERKPLDNAESLRSPATARAAV